MKRLVVLAAALTLHACDSGPKGPGVLDATVVAPQAVGAVVLEFEGTGIRGFVGQGDTRVYSAATPGRPGTFRVILVSAAGGTEIRFGLDLEDREAPLPTVTAVQATGPDNAAVPGTGLQVRIER